MIPFLDCLEPRKTDTSVVRFRLEEDLSHCLKRLDPGASREEPRPSLPSASIGGRKAEISGRGENIRERRISCAASSSSIFCLPGLSWVWLQNETGRKPKGKQPFWEGGLTKTQPYGLNIENLRTDIHKTNNSLRNTHIH